MSCFERGMHGTMGVIDIKMMELARLEVARGHNRLRLEPQPSGEP